jgi:signal transduction histidine kinase
VTVRAAGTKGPARDEPKAVGAFAAAQRLPYRLALFQVGVLAVGGLAGLLIANRGQYPLGPLLAAFGLALLGALFFQTIMAQQILRALIRHVGSRHAVPPAEVRSPFGLGRKLRMSMLAFVVMGTGTCMLFAMAPGRGPGAWLWLGIQLLSLVWLVILVVRDVVAPLHALEERSAEMGAGQLARPVPTWGEADEIGRLAMVFEQMRRSLRDRLRSTESINVDLEREVRRRTEALEQRNAELREALDKLRRAQDNLVRSEKLASMGRLVAGIAHEINNPVNAVINSLAPLEETVQQMAACCGSGELSKMVSDAQEILAVVQRGAARTKAIVQALHGYARGDETVERDVSLARSVDETLGLLAHRLRHVKVEKDVDPGARIRGFPGQIDQVLMNLLTNAAQAMGSAGGTIRVATAKRDEHVVLSVGDTGPGSPADVLPRIFDPFFTTKDVGEGSGLGLSIVHGIIERHRGQIEVDSKPGQGTTFTILFPKPAPVPV